MSTRYPIRDGEEASMYESGVQRKVMTPDKHL